MKIRPRCSRRSIQRRSTCSGRYLPNGVRLQHAHRRSTGSTLDCNLHASSKKTGEYFDSFGLPPLYPAFRRFLQDNCEEWTYNNKTLQSPLSTVCGQYCATYLLLWSRGVPMINFVKTFNTDIVANDRRVFNWIKDIGY